MQFLLQSKIFFGLSSGLLMYSLLLCQISTSPPPSFVPRFPFQVVLAACGAVGMLHTMKPAFLVFFVSAVQQRRELHSKDVRGKNEAQKRSSDILRPFYCPKKTSKSLDFSLQGVLRPFPR